MTFNFDAEKRKLVNKLESLEKVSIAYTTLKEYIKKVSVNDVLQQYVTSEVQKIEKAAAKFGIEFKIDVAELLDLFKKDNDPTVNVLPFVVSTNTLIYDIHNVPWRFDGKEWVQEWESSWESSAEC